MDMLSSLESLNREVLQHCKTSKFSNMDKSYEESDLFVSLLDIYYENVLQKFMLKHEDVDPEDCLVK